MKKNDDLSGVTIAKGFLPNGADPTNELGNSVIKLLDKKIIFVAPHYPQLHHTQVQPKDIPRIIWH